MLESFARLVPNCILEVARARVPKHVGKRVNCRCLTDFYVTDSFSRLIDASERLDRPFLIVLDKGAIFFVLYPELLQQIRCKKSGVPVQALE